MKEYHTGKIRNIALVSHNGAGKTTLVERLLFDTGVSTRMGSVQNGNAAMDFDEEEINRNSSVSTGIAPIQWKDFKLNILDTPGYIDFIGEVNSALKVAESAVVLVEAVAGVEVGTEIVWQAAKKANKPRLLLINKMDRDNVTVNRVKKSITENLDGNLIDLQLPIGEGPDFKGVVDLIKMEARLGNKGEVGPIPDDMADAAEEARVELIEAAAEGDDELLEKYFEDIELTNEEIVQGLKAAMMEGSTTPILYAAPEKGIAVSPLLDTLTQLLPGPDDVEVTAIDRTGNSVELIARDDGPLAAFIFKTREDPYGKTSYIRVFSGMLESDSRVWDANQDSEVRVGSLQIVTGKDSDPVNRLHSGDIGSVVKLGDAQTNDTLSDKSTIIQIDPIAQPNPIASVAIHPVSQSDVAKLSQSLNRLVGEDPTLSWTTERATNQTILSGMGTTHLDIAVKKAKSKFGVNFTTTVPKVPYRETITKTNSAEYTHKKQTGGAGQYARVFIRVESVDDQTDFEFASEIFGGAISQPFVAATEKGCRQALENGVLAGYPVVGVRAVVYDGKEHPVDSKEIAFQTAGREGFKKAVLGAGPVLLEPIYNVRVTVPSDNMGDVLGDFNTRRARVLGMDQEGTKSIVHAEVPLAEMQRYAADLRSMTQGRGVFEMAFLQYGRVPSHLQDGLVAALRQEQEEEKE
ncbi:MAG: elongation factor G [Candidatus Promineifilaceae bacterium]|nr:elongation factor G [Candidatus Promineifilaceae bacterium]